MADNDSANNSFDSAVGIIGNSDSDSTDYEPDTKKSKYEEGGSDTKSGESSQSSTCSSAQINQNYGGENVIGDEECNDVHQGLVEPERPQAKARQSAKRERALSATTPTSQDTELVRRTFRVGLSRRRRASSDRSNSGTSSLPPTPLKRLEVVHQEEDEDEAEEQKKEVEEPALPSKSSPQQRSESESDDSQIRPIIFSEDDGTTSSGSKEASSPKSATPCDLPSPPSSGGYITDDIDSDEIPDEVFSPPSPSPPHSSRYRERRNAIFEWRAPPPMTPMQQEHDQIYHNELEVASVSDLNENPIEDANSTSGAENQESEIEHSGRLNNDVDKRSPANQESDNNFADSESDRDGSDSDELNRSLNSSRGLNSSDSEISEKDKWLCTQCHAKTDPYFRYCSRCFKVRRNWLPKRPASKRLKRRNRKKAQAAAQQNSSLNTSRTSFHNSSDSSEGEDVVDGLVRRQSAPSNPSTAIAPSPMNLNEAFIEDDGNSSLHRLDNNSYMDMLTPPESNPSESQRSIQTVKNIDSGASTDVSSQTDYSQTQSSSLSSQSQSQPSSNSQTSSQSQSSPSDFLSPPIMDGSNRTCNICFARSKNAAFVHNRVAHQYSCYACADRILKRNGKCPICRERILRVVKVYIV